ncbi:hypothetical protein OROGR_012474 [Orobanche gracilis]
MGSSAAIRKACNSLLCAAVLAASMGAVMVAAFQFHVGDKGRGWKIPTGNEPETYNEWAAKNRFHIGDTLYFKYEKDSVLVVNSTDYSTCNTSNPISKFEDGNTVFEFDRSGLFYFISGHPGHCKLGQRLIVRVMHPSNIGAPVLAPSPAPGPSGDSGDGDSGDGRLPGPTSAGNLSVVSYSALLGVIVVMVYYLFM